ncbi:MAG: tripartite tricarboxylate transporter TctB family protein [Mangrovicoccus sp.]
MKPDFRGDADHHDGTSDATPGGYESERRPGELAFAAFLVIASLILLGNAYGIAGFEALSSPGAVPMATTATMVITSAMVLIATFRKAPVTSESLTKDILPPLVIILLLALVAFGILLEPLGFVPTAAIFLTGSMKLLARRSWGYTLLVSLGSLVAIWLIFRIVFTVLLPSGILPEAEMIQAMRDLIAGGAE